MSEGSGGHVPGRGGGGGGGEGEERLQYKKPGCMCWGSENVPILKDALGQKTITILKGSMHTSYPYYGVIRS